MERKSLDSHQDTPWKTLELSYTEEVAGSSPVPPTRLGAVTKGQPPQCNLEILGFPRGVYPECIEGLWIGESEKLPLRNGIYENK